MAIIIITSTPNLLLKSIYDDIDKEHIKTWGYDGEKDFTHDVQQWKDQAWLRPSVAAGILMFGIIGRQGTVLSKEVYAIYHGRFIEMLLAHFDKSFSNATATALLEPPDLYKPAPGA